MSPFLMMYIITVVCGHEPEYPDINDIFPSFKDPAPVKYEDHRGAMVRNATIEIEKLDFIKFRKKMAEDLKNKIEEEDRELKMSKKDGRRARIYYIPGYEKQYNRSSTQMTNQKVVDLMLQLVYMSRQKIQQIEKFKEFQNYETAEFRVGYIYDKMSNIVDKMVNLLSYMHKSCKTFDHTKDTRDIDKHISLHSRIVRLHVDYNYLYWVLVHLDEAYRENKSKLRPKLLVKDKDTGGISQEIINEDLRDWSDP